MTLSTGIALDGLVAEGFGLSAPVTTRETALQDDPGDPSTASFSTTLDVVHGAEFTVSIGNSDLGSDLDLYVYGPDGSLVGASFSPIDTESVTVAFPEDGTYRIDVHGFTVPGGTDQFDLTIDAVQGTDVTVSGLVGLVAGRRLRFVQRRLGRDGQAIRDVPGMVLIGPADSPGVLQLPLEVTVP